jgi:Flp pilus assembly protein TadG
MTDLRNLAKRRYRESEDRQQTIDTTRRLAVLFFFGLGGTLATAMVAETVARRLIGSAVEKIKHGLRDDNGVVAIEAAILFPILLLLFMGAMTLMQGMHQRMTAQFVAQASAAVGRTILNTPNNGGLPAIQQAAQAVFSANQPLFMFGAQASLDSVTLDANNNVVVSVTATSSPLFPLSGIGNMTASVTATD